jgi:peroxiredoxin Q/BCP
MATKKKTATKKTATKKTATKKTATKKKAAPKKAAPKKAAPKKAAPKKAAPKKAAATATTTTAAASSALQEGAKAPAFSLPGDDGKTHSLADHKGTPVVLYFYPRDNTPGCTVEACDFRDNLARVSSKGAVVYGVSRDTLKSHDKFREKFQLNFPLLSDEDLAVHRAYGAWGKKVMYGKQVEGTIRSTFLIDGNGKLARVWPKVRVEGHVDAVIEALNHL